MTGGGPWFAAILAGPIVATVILRISIWWEER